MTINDLPGMLLQTVQDHIPTGAAWVPLAVLAGIAGAGLILMTRGARLAPGLTAVAIAFGGGALGAMLVPLVNTPFWPTVAIASTLGLVFGIVLFRLWLAILVAGCLVVASLGVYANQTLRDPLNTYLSRGLDVQNQEITLRPAGEVVAARSTAQTELAGLWDYLSDTVPAFKSSVFVILTAAAVAGLIFALLLPGFAPCVLGRDLRYGIAFTRGLRGRSNAVARRRCLAQSLGFDRGRRPLGRVHAIQLG